MDANSLLVHFAGNAVRFSSGAGELNSALSFHFRHCAREEDEPVLADYEITALQDNQFSATRSGESFFSELNFRSALWQLTQDAITALNGAASEELVFHAAALTHHEDAVILCGKSGSGKSSLAAWLSAEGMGYMTDEVISRPLNNQIINGFSQSIVLKPGSFFIWERWLADAPPDASMRFQDNSIWVDPTYFNDQAITSSAIPKLLIFPRYERYADFQVTPISSANALFHLMQNLVNARNFSDYGFAETSRLARQVKAYEMVFSNIESASSWIKTRLETN